MRLSESLTYFFQIWAFLWCGFFREIGITAFFSTINHYVVHSTTLTLHEAARGPTIMEGCAIIGIVVIMFTTIRFKYSKLPPHAATSVGYAVFILCITFVNSKVRVCVRTKL